MATNTYVALDKITVSGSSTASITFTSIPSTYTDLRIVFNGGSATAGNINVQYNGDTGTNYSYTWLTGDGTSATSGRQSNQSYFFANYYGYLDNAFQTVISIDVLNYSNSTTYKTALCRANNASNGVASNVGLWRSTAAINSITLYTGGTNFLAGSTFTLYGIRAEGASGTKATGGTIYSDSTYFYHVFSSSGTFTPTQSLSADVLVVAGGGGGGVDDGGGGGAGGVAYQASRSLSATGYSITVGSGGARSATTGNAGTSGTNSTFDTITATGGGGGGTGAGNTTAKYGQTGGSGGGAPYGDTTKFGTGTTGTSGGATLYGNSGGGSASTSAYGCGGGGGAGAVGGTGTTTAGGAGGAGLNTWSAWSTATGTGSNGYYAGGGGGSLAGSGTVAWGAGGAGGGGTGSSSTVNASAGLANTGGGGGGGIQVSGSGIAGDGGSGIVIVRYAK